MQISNCKLFVAENRKMMLTASFRVGIEGIKGSLLWGDNWPQLVSIRDAALADVETVYLRDGDRTKSIYSVS